MFHPSICVRLSFAGLLRACSRSQLTLSEQLDKSPVHHRAQACLWTVERSRSTRRELMQARGEHASLHGKAPRLPGS